MGIQGPWTYTRDGETQTNVTQGTLFRLTSIDGSFIINQGQAPNNKRYLFS